MNIKNRVDRLFDDLNADKQVVELKNGETLYLSQEDILSLYVEAIKFMPVVDNNGDTLTSDDLECIRDRSEMSEKLKRMSLAYPDQSKAIEFIRKVAAGDVNEQ